MLHAFYSTMLISAIFLNERIGRECSTEDSCTGGARLDTGYPDRGFPWFSLVHPGTCRDSASTGYDRFLLIEALLRIESV
jgi:hypothetical protein